jgi:hypothetical protein
MNKQSSLLAVGACAGLLSLISSLGAADATAPAMAPAASSGSAAMAPKAPAASAAPAMASGSAAAPSGPKADLTKLPAPSTRTDITFDADIAPMLKASCAICHGGATPRSGLDLTSKDAIIKGGKKGKDVVAGHSDQSLIVLYAGDTIAKEEMPPLARRTAATPVNALTKDQLAVLRAWIDQGAK